MAKIEHIRALEILDSRGNPTVRVRVSLDDGAVGEASVPAGASTGIHEAHELRDGDAERYRGLGVRHAVANVEGEIQRVLRRRSANAQERVDALLCELDGTPSKERLGANAILGVSLAVARAAAWSVGLPLYAYLRRLVGRDPQAVALLPVPHMNLINGGRHADSGLDIQEFMILPVGAPTMREAVRWGSDVFRELGKILKSRGQTTAVGDEGGYAPRLERNDEAFDLMREATEAAKRSVKSEVVFGIDAASSEFYASRERAYALRAPVVTLPSERLVALFCEWVREWTLVSIEDPLEQDDWDGWATATEKLRSAGVQVVGDDFFATNVERLRRGIERRCASAILIKVNQIGTLSETLAAVRVAQENGLGVVISHRSGETADTFIADLAVATDAGQIKTGSLSRSERVEKYNRLMEIEAELGERARYAGRDTLRT